MPCKIACLVKIWQRASQSNHIRLAHLDDQLTEMMWTGTPMDAILCSVCAHPGLSCTLCAAASSCWNERPEWGESKMQQRASGAQTANARHHMFFPQSPSCPEAAP
eukprot:1157218-Pelagomonas_calceolata.AAC.7